MKRVVVFDTGWGGELLAEKLAEALPYEIEKVIPWRDGTLEEGRSAAEIRRLVERRLAEANCLTEECVIVLAEPGVALAAKAYLERKYPQTRFIGGLMGLKPAEKMLVLATPGLRSREEYQLWRARSQEVVEPDCTGWAEKIYDGELDERTVRAAVEGYREGTVMILSTNFIDVRNVVEKEVGRRVKVVDLSNKIVRKVCSELGLLGVDGERAGR